MCVHGDVCIFIRTPRTRSLNSHSKVSDNIRETTTSSITTDHPRPVSVTRGVLFRVRPNILQTIFIFELLYMRTLIVAEQYGGQSFFVAEVY